MSWSGMEAKSLQFNQDKVEVKPVGGGKHQDRMVGMASALFNVREDRYIHSLLMSFATSVCFWNSNCSRWLETFYTQEQLEMGWEGWVLISALVLQSLFSWAKPKLKRFSKCVPFYLNYQIPDAIRLKGLVILRCAYSIYKRGTNSSFSFIWITSMKSKKEPHALLNSIICLILEYYTESITILFSSQVFGQCQTITYINRPLKKEILHGYNCTVSPGTITSSMNQHICNKIFPLQMHKQVCY